MSARAPVARRGGILPMTLAVALLVAALLALSSQRMLGVRQLQDASGERLRAQYAAEATASLCQAQIEASLLAAGSADNFAGKPQRNWSVAMVGDAIVRWRIDSLRLVEGDPVAPARWTGLPPVGKQPTPTAPDYAANAEFWTYRVACEGFALTRADNPYRLGFTAVDLAGPPAVQAMWRLPDAPAPSLTAWAPWNDPRERAARVRVVRDLVVQARPLCAWAIFYSAPDPTGDCLLWAPTGGSLTIDGAVHANGFIRCGAGGAGGMGAVNVGSAAAPVTVTTARDLVAGGGPSTVAIDGIAVTPATDSTPADTTWMTGSPFRDLVRDEDKGVRPIRTIDSALVLPTADDLVSLGERLDSHAFEYAQSVGAGVQLYSRDGQFPSTCDLTIFPVAGVSKPLYYASDPNTYSGQPDLNVTIAPATTDWPVFADGMPLFKIPNGVAGGRVDVWPDANAYGWGAATNVPAPPTTTWTFSNGGWPVRSTSPLRLAMSGWLYDAAASRGLVVLERARRTGLERPMPSAADPAFIGKYADYLVDRYCVLAPSGDVTDQFFRFHANTTDDPTQDPSLLCASVGTFHDPRQAQALLDRGLLDATGAAAFRVDALTLNWRQIKAFLQQTLQPPTGPAHLVDAFDGVIYVARAPLVTWGGTVQCDPVKPFGYHPVFAPRPSPAALAEAPPFQASVPFVHQYRADDPVPGARARVEVRPPLCYKAVRLAQADDIPYGRVGDGAASDWPEGLLLVTPDQCYLQGTINTVLAPRPSDGSLVRAPCAVLADGVTALSDAWSDALHLLPGVLTLASGPTGSAGAVVQHVALCTGNQPPNPGDDASGPVAVVRLLEDWTSTTYRLEGSLAVVGSQRYSDAKLGAGMWFQWPAAWSFAYDPLLAQPQSRHWLFPLSLTIAKSVGTLRYDD